jgi:small subunit ribosomal protein S10
MPPAKKKAAAKNSAKETKKAAPAKKPAPAKKKDVTPKAPKAPSAKVKKAVAATPKQDIRETQSVPAAAPKAPSAPAATKPKEVEITPPAAPKLKGIRIRLSAFDHTVLDETSLKIVDTAMRTGAIVHGPTPLPTKIKKFTVNRSTFVHKDARDQFEMRIHRRLIDLTETTFKTVDSLQNLSLPSGVDIEILMG